MNAMDKFCKYFYEGCTDKQRIGLELEHFIIKEDGTPLSYSDGVSGILDEITSVATEIFSESGNILGADMGDYTLTLEPGAQLEVSVAPKENPDDITDVLEDFYALAQPVIKKHNAHFECKGVLDERLLPDIEIIPKKRYEYMDRYFKTSGTMGRYMMRGSASVQVSIDYESEADFVKKFRLAYLLSPFFALMTAGERTDTYLKRLEIWDNVDKDRTYIPDDLFCDSFGFEAYARQLMEVPAIFMPCGDGYVYTENEPIKALLEKYGMDKKNTEHFLSMVFPDVRLKQYIEIRIADSIDARSAVSYAKFIKSVFYTDLLDTLLDRYKYMGIDDIKRAKLEIREKGIDAIVYGKSAKEEIEYLLRLADLR